VLLLDEPLSNLDPALRERTRRELAALLGELGITTLIVTHEQEEAFELGQRVALLHAGRLDQVGTPEELYRRPATRFAAGFVGRASFVPVEVVSVAGNEARVRGADLPGGVVAADAAEPLAAGRSAEAMLRPEALELARSDEPGAVEAEVRSCRFGGALSWITAETVRGVALEIQVAGTLLAPGERIAIRLREGARPRIFGAEPR